MYARIPAFADHVFKGKGNFQTNTKIDILHFFTVTFPSMMEIDYLKSKYVMIDFVK